MSKIGDTKSIATKKPGIARSAIAGMLLALVLGCGDAGTDRVYIGPGTGGSVGSGGAFGTGGAGGTGGMVGTGGTTGTGGMSGTGASSGTGGMVGTGGSGGAVGPCVADTPPDSFPCNIDDTCPFSGWVCIASGCEDTDGAPIKQCVPSWAGSCSSDNGDDDCPNPRDYDCTTVKPGGERCVRVVDGCNPLTETYDCAPGFSCEGPSREETCVDRRVPCDLIQDCPKNHICLTVSGGKGPIAKYCARVSRTCHVNTDCTWLGNSFGSFCADVDNDGRKECVGKLDTSGEDCLKTDSCGCVNAYCGGSAPVCEMGAPTAASCGDYGLCLTNNDCGTGFECAPLWQDERKECVPTGGTCNQVTDCLLPNQVCAAPRNGGPPSCQAGSVP
jgi:hypothetical protein